MVGGRMKAASSWWLSETRPSSLSRARLAGTSARAVISPLRLPRL